VRPVVSVLAVGGLAAWCAPAPAPVVPELARRLRIQTRLTSARGIALTFDDGPHPDGTPEVLDVLERAGARATFFLVGEQVERWPELAATIVAAGHEVGCHGYRHVLQLRRTPRALREDFRRATEILTDATGGVPRYYRPPYGVFSSVGLSIARRGGCVPLLWSRWGRDWTARATAQTITAEAGADLAAGDVVLLHDSDAYSSPASWRRTVSALPSIVEAVARTGEPLVSVSQSR